MNRPYGLNSARMLRTGREQDNPCPMTPWQQSRMGPGFPDARRSAGSLFPRFAILLGVLALGWMLARFL